MTIFSSNLFNSSCTLCTDKMCVILQCFLTIPKKHFIVKIIQKTHIKLISVAITIIKKTINLIYLRKRMYWFSCTKQLVIKKAAAGTIKLRNLLSQKLEVFNICTHLTMIYQEPVKNIALVIPKLQYHIILLLLFLHSFQTPPPPSTHALFDKQSLLIQSASLPFTELSATIAPMKYTISPKTKLKRKLFLYV